MNEIPERVTFDPDRNIYVWSADLDMNVENTNYEKATGIGVGICIALFLVGVVFAIYNHSWTAFFCAVVFEVVILLINVGVLNGEKNMGQRRRPYRMMDKLIATGAGRRRAVFEFKNAEVMIIGKRYIELQKRFAAFRAYVPVEDLEFVRDYIQSRVPTTCEVRYEQ